MPSSHFKSIPDISVLLATYNGEKYLRSAIESVLNQTFQNYELIIIDDGSTDASWNVITEFTENYPNVIGIRNTNNQGTSTALNSGLGIARGKYITRQDDDDISLPSRLESQFRFMELNSDYSAVATPAIIIDQENIRIKTNFSLPGEEIEKRLLDKMCVCGPTVMVRSTAFKRAGFFFSDDLSYTEDYDLCLRISEFGRFGNLDEPHYLYRQHSGSVSSKKRFTQLYRKAIALERALARRFPENPPDIYIDLLARDFIRSGTIGVISEQYQEAQNSFIKAIAIKPDIFYSNEPVNEVISRYIAAENSKDPLQILDLIFSGYYPKTKAMKKIHAKLKSKYLLDSAYISYYSSNYLKSIKNIIQAISLDFSHLNEKGVQSILLKSMVNLLRS